MHKNEGYLGNINVKRSGVQTEWTEEQILEYKKCMENPVHFIENYIKIISLDEIKGEKIVCTQTIKNLKVSF